MHILIIYIHSYAYIYIYNVPICVGRCVACNTACRRRPGIHTHIYVYRSIYIHA